MFKKLVLVTLMILFSVHVVEIQKGFNLDTPHIIHNLLPCEGLANKSLMLTKVPLMFTIYFIKWIL